MRAVSVVFEVSAARGLVFSFCWKLLSCSPPMLDVASHGTWQSIASRSVST